MIIMICFIGTKYLVSAYPPFSKGISDTVFSRSLLQVGNSFTTFTRHHHHNFPCLITTTPNPIPSLSTQA
jgi:hypothetical protein